MVYFWACEVSESKAAVVKVPTGFVLNVCNATLASDAASPVSLGVETTQMDSKAWKGVVAHLGAAVHAHQVKLDLVFMTQTKFYVTKGTGKINLTGYFQPGPPADLFEGATTETVVPTSSKKNKKRARDEPVTWDQAALSDSEEDEAKPKAAKPAAPAKSANPAAPQQNKSKPAAAVANGAASAESSKKKHRKNKNKKDKKE